MLSMGIRWIGDRLTSSGQHGRRVVFVCGCMCDDDPDGSDPTIAGSVFWSFCSEEHDGWAIMGDENDLHCTELGLMALRPRRAA